SWPATTRAAPGSLRSSCHRRRSAHYNSSVYRRDKLRWSLTPAARERRVRKRPFGRKMSMSSPEPGGTSAPRAKLSTADEDVLARLFEGWERLAEDEDILPPLSPLASRLLA